jgi:hypothetical protein
MSDFKLAWYLVEQFFINCQSNRNILYEPWKEFEKYAVKHRAFQAIP